MLTAKGVVCKRTSAVGQQGRAKSISLSIEAGVAAV